MGCRTLRLSRRGQERQQQQGRGLRGPQPLTVGEAALRPVRIDPDEVFTDDAIRVWLSDGRAVAVPLGWYPRLCDVTADERSRWEPADDGTAVRWPDLDEDVSVAGFQFPRYGVGRRRRRQLGTGPSPTTLMFWFLSMPEYNAYDHVSRSFGAAGSEGTEPV